tara:strand:+ start:3047 stop:3148 length:102 start_codon:yes stop_codon:yes gene_type:complete
MGTAIALNCDPTEPTVNSGGEDIIANKSAATLN